MESNDIQKRLGENLKKIRKEKKWTQFELAEKSGLSEDTVKSIELCRVWPSEKSLNAICLALGVDIYKLFLPIPSSIAIDSEIQGCINSCLKEGFQNFVQESLKRIVD